MRKSQSRHALDVLPVYVEAPRAPPRKSASGYLGQTTERDKPRKWVSYADTLVVLVCVLVVSVLVWLYAVHKLYITHYNEPKASPYSVRAEP
jgi:hypothetical protein